MSNRYEAVGTLHAKMETQEISGSFRKSEFVLEIQDGNYAQTVKFQLVQDKTALIDDFEIGDEVRVSFSLKGRAYTRRNDGATDYFVNLDCWRIEGTNTRTNTKQDNATENEARNGPPVDLDFEDVPF